MAKTLAKMTDEEIDAELKEHEANPYKARGTYTRIENLHKEQLRRLYEKKAELERKELEAYRKIAEGGK